ncbi:LexA repressor [Actinoplanes friuliensis DSM 7358]|uniref:LexA repressor n=2 Tax=Actinoplanes friuliensis TaxID=196914 RepID=U5VN78_9ACTN|nr:LexA repressor [Actinoplanes friuliensis DSM 7358]
MAHPVRLRILSLLTGASLTAADVGRELGLTHANASYHLRQLLAAGMIVQAGEERIRGGVAKRYRYDSERDRARDRETFGDQGFDTQRALFAAVANELTRRTAEANWSVGATMTDAELWVDPEVWREIRDRIVQASRDLHDAAQAPRTPGTVRTSSTIAMFRMEDS